MFDEPTVLVLGAGASAPFGYPLGDDLLTNMIKGIRSIASERGWSNHRPDRVQQNFVLDPYRALEDFITTNAKLLAPYEIIGSPSALWQLAEELDRSSHRTIDEFARTNPGLRDVVKLFISLEIARHTYCPTAFGKFKLEPPPALFAGSRASWYGRLVSQIRAGCTSVLGLEDNNVTVVTFNYDQSLETYLDHELPNAEIFKGADYRSSIPVIHVHGMINLPPYKQAVMGMQFGQSLVDASTGFVMIGERRDSLDSSAAAAKSAIQRASRTIVLGFDLAPENCALIGLENPDVAEKTVMLNWNGSNRVTNRALALGVPSDNILKPPPGGKLEIVHAIDDGLFE